MKQLLVKQFSSLSSGMKMLVFGGGYSGQCIASLARSLGVETLCSRRSIDKKGADFVFNSFTKEIPCSKTLEGTTHIISCIPPGENGKDPVLELLEERIKNMPLQWAGYLSTTGVYGDSQGAWVNEFTTPRPQQLRSKRRLQCEKEWLNTGIPVQILRLPGIYGPGRSALEIILSGKCRLVDKPGQVFSRIHVEDIAAATMHLIALSAKSFAPKIINISDNLPSTNIDVLKYGANLINFSLPNVEPFEIASKEMSPMALSFWQENRRVSNKFLCEKLNYSLIYPDFKAGLNNCFLNLNQN
tara:strand:+ start:13772 stop:14671 length:900 start_codon:yes stop_codon:yes gene_type:complete